MNETGEARWAHMGSMRMRRPPISTIEVACPSHVTRRPEAGGSAKSPRLRVSVGTGSVGLVGAFVARHSLNASRNEGRTLERSFRYRPCGVRRGSFVFVISGPLPPPAR
jgi:hypothetical protein